MGSLLRDARDCQLSLLSGHSEVNSPIGQYTSLSLNIPFLGFVPAIDGEVMSIDGDDEKEEETKTGALSLINGS